MKRVLLAVLLFGSAVVFAAGFSFVSLSAATSTGAGTAFEPKESGAKDFTWTVVVTGSPSSETTNMEGSIDGTNWFTLDSSTTTTSEMRHVVNKDVAYLRCNLAALSGGSSPTVTCRIYKGNK